MWPPNLVTICAWLPKLVTNVSSQFQHLVNTGLAVGFLVKWLPIMVAHTCKLDNLSSLYLADWKWLHPIVIALYTLCPVQFYFQWCVTLHWTHWGSYFEKLICPCLGSQFFKKLPQLIAIQNFQSSHLRHGESLNHNVLSHYHQTHIEHIFENIIYITRKTPNLVAKILAVKFGFVPDW